MRPVASDAPLCTCPFCSRRSRAQGAASLPPAGALPCRLPRSYPPPALNTVTVQGLGDWEAPVVPRKSSQALPAPEPGPAAGTGHRHPALVCSEQQVLGRAPEEETSLEPSAAHPAGDQGGDPEGSGARRGGRPHCDPTVALEKPSTG
ncbi:hypothetical protein VULLAG_LOCUS16049 [Vulpes lagopus]